MQSEDRLFDDLSKVINGVAGTMAGMGREAEASMKERMREWVGGLDMVSREEFDAVKQMAANARAEADLLSMRLDKLEAAMGNKSAAKPSATVKAISAKAPAAKRAPAVKK
jgi:BMFP domain-containing protein YqiC